MNGTIEKYVKQFAHLHTDTSRARWTEETHHRAPHKPLLLLAVIDLFAEGAISSNLIELTSELGETFTLYWARAMPPDRRGIIALPFFYLKSDGFWHLIAQPGKENILAATHKAGSVNQFLDLILGARLDEELYNLICVEESRNLLRTTLIETYFSPEVQRRLIEQGAINVEAFQYSQRLLEQVRTQQKAAGKEPLRPAARDQGFRRAVVTAYEHRCALCGIRMMTADGHTVVDAAHIKPWSVSYNDDPRNGMALCRLCHWSFDEGMLGVSSHYLVITSPQLSANHNVPGHVVTLAGRNIIGPGEQLFWPDLDSLSWHRQNVFRNR